MFAEELGMEHPRELGIICTRHKTQSSMHRQQIDRMGKDPALPDLLEPRERQDRGSRTRRGLPVAADDEGACRSRSPSGRGFVSRDTGDGP